MPSLPLPLSQALLYVPGAFFCYPWKPGVNEVYGDNYPTAYRHFSRDHSVPINLVLHVVCLVFQLLGNFLLLDKLDAELTNTLSQHGNFLGLRPISQVTAVFWSAYMLLRGRKEAPLSCIFLSTLMVGAAFGVAPLVTAEQVERGIIVLYCVVLLIMMRHKVKAVAVVTWLGLWLSFLGFLEANYLGIIPNGSTTTRTTLGWLAVVVLVSTLPGGVPGPTTVIAMMTCPIASIFCDAPWIRVWGYAFLATFLQGLAHKLSKEEATLVLLNQKECRSTHEEQTKKLMFEWAHVTFFPLLSVHASWEAVAQRKRKPKRV